MFETHRKRLLGSLDTSHSKFYEANIFTGPSLHFHFRALEASREADLDRFTQSVYALLVAWGMHRMGPGGSKMRGFEEFETSVKKVWKTILKLQKISPHDLDETSWKELQEVFCKIRSMASGTSLVGNSKVMAHAIPNLIPPVDRQYTLRYLYGNINIKNGLEHEWEKLQLILKDFFYPLLRDDTFRTNAAAWQKQQDHFPLDTSPLKIADNLIIGRLKLDTLQLRTT